MQKNRKTRPSTISREGPIRPGSPLYAVLTRIAEEVAKSLDEKVKRQPDSRSVEQKKST